ncbi:LbetaH domain-containing protein [Dielma fastidiosa]|uniref:Galactoside O-acetyltransferase n=1 Tax=Dielma fastidiosa TaxID=1034346 RepID=A0AB35UL68_9FIRM|nr:hypothetical protein [Dielma fastidiosa]MDY5167556.1 hypothetical protein [Dielma fastidiosa]
MNIFERLKSGEAIHMRKDKAYQTTALAEMNRCRKLCFTINHSEPDNDLLGSLEQELFSQSMSFSSYFTPPFQVDFGCQMTIGEHVFANHGLICMSAGGITLEAGVMLGPNVSLLTVNHDFNDLQIICCKPTVIKKGAWLGANVTVLPVLRFMKARLLAAAA